MASRVASSTETSAEWTRAIADIAHDDVARTRCYAPGANERRRSPSTDGRRDRRVYREVVA
jgi:hypothetical protein